jgi:hypothetical protein
MRAQLIFCTALLVGCNLDKLKENVEGLTNPLVAEGLFLGVEPPSSQDIDLSGTEFDNAAAAAVMLADASNVNDLEEAPVTEAAVGVLSDAIGRVDLHEDSDGTYSASADDGLVYTEGDDVVLSMGVGNTTAKMGARLPRSPNVAGIPASGAPNAGFTVDLSGQDFDNVLVVVLDGATGDVTFDNRPDDIKAIYDLTHGEGSLVVEVPGGAVPDESIYLVGVAGLKNTDSSDMDEVNTALSAFITGRMAFTAHRTLPAP